MPGGSELRNREREDFGALVGWTTSRKGGLITLRVQGVDKPPPHAKNDVHSHFYVLTDQQAVQLGHTLYKAAGQTLPDNKGRGLFARLFG